MSASLPAQGREVARAALLPFIEYSARELGSEQALFSPDLEHLLARPDRFAWAELCELYRRLEHHVRNKGGLEVLFADEALRTSFKRALQVVGLVATPTLLYTLGNRLGLARMFNHLKVHDQVLADGSLIVEVTIPESHPDCEEFFQATAGILAAFPELIGRGRALVKTTRKPRWGRFVITPPPSLPLTRRIRRAVSAFTLGRHALQEMTEQQARLNSQYIELQKTSAKMEKALRVRRRFLSVISHELRTPLNGIVGAASALTHASEGEQAEMREALDGSIGLMSDLVETILEFTRLDEGSAPVEHARFRPREDLKDTLRKARTQALEKGLGFTTDLDPSLPDCVGVDGQRILQVVSQLVGNAVKFTKAGEVGISMEYASGLLCIEVQDSGLGISEEDIPRAFEMFTQLDTTSTRAVGGIGLGLTLARQLAEFLGGTIDLRSEVGVGTRVRVEIACELREPLSQSQAAPRGDMGCRRVLVADDVRTNRAVLRHKLKKKGYEVVVAEDGKQAHELALAQSFALIFMDCEMPIMDGFEATRQILATVDNPARIVAVTAYVTDEDRARCFEVGMDDFISKPVKDAEIDRVLDDWLPSVEDEP